LDLPAPVCAKEAAQLLLMGPFPPLRLVLKDAVHFELPLGLDDSLHCGRTEGSNQLILQVCHTHVEPESFHVRPSQV